MSNRGTPTGPTYSGTQYQEGYDSMAKWLDSADDPVQTARVALGARTGSVDPSIPFNMGGNQACRDRIKAAE